MQTVEGLKVGVTVVRELYGVMAACGATGGFVVTCGRFTDEARAFSSGRNVTLVDGSELEKLIREASGRAKSIQTIPVTQTTVGIPDPRCPTCGSAMVERTAKRAPAQAIGSGDAWRIRPVRAPFR